MYRRFNRITVSIAAKIPLEEAHEQVHGEAWCGENRRRNVRNARSRNGLRIIGEENAQDRPPSPVDLGDGDGCYHSTTARAGRIRPPVLVGRAGRRPDRPRPGYPPPMRVGEL